jgi:hypothetical protein
MLFVSLSSTYGLYVCQVHTLCMLCSTHCLYVCLVYTVCMFVRLSSTYCLYICLVHTVSKLVACRMDGILLSYSINYVGPHTGQCFVEKCQEGVWSIYHV